MAEKTRKDEKNFRLKVKSDNKQKFCVFISHAILSILRHVFPLEQVGVMAKRFGLPVLLFACLDAQCLAAGCRTAAEHNQPATTRTQSTSGRNSTAAFRAALIPGSSNSEANTKARVKKIYSTIFC